MTRDMDNRPSIAPIRKCPPPPGQPTAFSLRSSEKADSSRRLKVTPAAKTASPRPPEEAASDGPLETAPSAPGGAGGCRLRPSPFLPAGRCHLGGGAIVD